MIESNNKNKKTIMGAIIGDIVGSRFEFHPNKSKDFELLQKPRYVKNEFNLAASTFDRGSYFTDDTILTLAICDAIDDTELKEFCEYDDQRIYYDYNYTYNHKYKILRTRCHREYLIKETKEKMIEFGRRYPHGGYGSSFKRWLFSADPQPYNSCGNGSAMRVSGVAYTAGCLEEVKELSQIVTEVTHNHPEGLKGAEAVAVAMWLALHGKTKQEIKEYIEQNYFYFLDFDYDYLIKNYGFGSVCQNTVPQSIYAFLISNSYEDAIRTTISLGGDADTMGAITGAIAGAYYGVPQELIDKAKEFLTADLLEVVERFDKEYCDKYKYQN